MRKANIALSAGILAMVGFIGLMLLYMTPEHKNALSPLKMAQKSKILSPNKLVHQHPIEGYDLFGRKVNVGATPVNMRLKGILTNGNGVVDGAVIAIGSSLERLYREGQTLSNGYKLDKIDPQKVTLSYKGKTSVIKLKRKPSLQNQSTSLRQTPEAKSTDMGAQKMPKHWQKELQKYQNFAQ